MSSLLLAAALISAAGGFRSATQVQWEKSATRPISGTSRTMRRATQGEYRIRPRCVSCNRRARDCPSDDDLNQSCIAFSSDTASACSIASWPENELISVILEGGNPKRSTRDLERRRQQHRTISNVLEKIHLVLPSGQLRLPRAAWARSEIAINERIATI